MNIYVGNVPYAATEEDLEALFSEYGPVATATIILDRDTGHSKGFGFVEMENQEDGKRAIEALNRYRLMGRPLRVNPARPREQRREPFHGGNRSPQSTGSRETSPPHSESSPDGTFHNPYTFVPTPPRPSSEFAGDFNPLKNDPPLDHASLKPNLWTGHIPIKLTTVTPLVLLKSDGRGEDSTEEPYDVHSRIPESSLRGMLRSAYEVVTNSRYGAFRNDNRLAYRMNPRQSLELIPAIIEDGSKHGELKAQLYPGTSDITPQRPEGPMYAAMLDVNSTYVGGGEPKTRDEVWAKIDRREHRRYRYWKVTKIWLKSNQPTKPSDPGKIVKGSVLITNENMGNKHDERVFFVDGKNAKNPIKRDVTHLKEAWRMRIQSYRDAHPESDIFNRKGAMGKPWRKIGRDPGDTAWSPHLYEDGKHTDRWGRPSEDTLELRAGNMVYARCRFDSKGNVEKITDLFPVMISRELYENSPKDLLDVSLRPAKELRELSPADRLFGWVPQEQGDDSGYKSRIRVVCEGSEDTDIVEEFEGGPLPLTILGQPKPAQGRFYVAGDDKGIPQHGKRKQDAGYKASAGKRLRGRKQYWHHKGLEAEQAPDYWKASSEDRTQRQTNGRYQEYRRPDKFNNRNQQFEQQIDSQNRSIKGWIKPGTVFKASLYVQNLQPEEIGALLWLLSRPEDYYFRLGYGKPLGFGSVHIEIDTERLIKGCLPLGTRKDWKAYYKGLNASLPAELNDEGKADCIQQFKSKMIEGYKSLVSNSETNDLQAFNDLPFISGFLQVLSGPKKDDPIHYPRLEHKPNPEGKNFEWFRDNESNSKRALPRVTDEESLPYNP